MPDGSTISAQEFHRLRTTAYSEFYRSNVDQFVSSFRDSIPGSQWQILHNWMYLNRGERQLTVVRQANFIALLALYAGKSYRDIPQVIQRIKERGSAAGTFIALR